MNNSGLILKKESFFLKGIHMILLWEENGSLKLVDGGKCCYLRNNYLKIFDKKTSRLH